MLRVNQLLISGKDFRHSRLSQSSLTPDLVRTQQTKGPLYQQVRGAKATRKKKNAALIKLSRILCLETSRKKQF